MVDLQREMHGHVTDLLFAVGTMWCAEALQEIVGEAIARLPASTFCVQNPRYTAYIEVSELNEDIPGRIGRGDAVDGESAVEGCCTGVAKALTDVRQHQAVAAWFFSVLEDGERARKWRPTGLVVLGYALGEKVEEEILDSLLDPEAASLHAH